MAKYKFTASLNERSLNELANQLKNYRQNTLRNKVYMFANALAQEGITIAESNGGSFGKHITFYFETNKKEDGCVAIIYAEDRKKIVSKWVTKDGEQSREISPILMAEFGSGLHAFVGKGSGARKYPYNAIGFGGQGTMPNQTHAFDENGWYWKETENGPWKHSTGISPSMPMFKASQSIIMNVNRIAKEVFG